MLWILLIGLVASQTTLSSNFYATPTDGSTASDLVGFTEDWRNIYCTDTGIDCGDVTVVSVVDGTDGIVATYELPVSAENTGALQASNFGEILATNLQNSPNLGPHFAGQTVTIWFYQKSSSQFDPYLDTLESSMVSALGLDASQVIMGTPTQSGANVYLTYTIPTDATWTSTGSGSTYEVYLRSMSEIETLNSLTGAFVETMVMFNGDSTISDLTSYQEELRIAWANSLGVPESDVSIVNIGPNGFNAITFGHIYSSTAATALASDTFYDSWRDELSQIDGLNSILGLTVTSLTVQLSDVTVSGLNVQFIMTEPISGAMVYWTVARDDAGAVADANVISGTGLCDGSTLQSADAYEQYVNCHLDASEEYKLYMYYADGDDGGTVVTSFQTGGQLYIPYTYTFIDTSVSDVEAYWHLVAESFATHAGVGSSYVFVGSSSDTDNGALVQLMFPFTSYTQAVTSEASFVTSFESEMSKHEQLAPFVASSNVYQSVGGYEYATEADALAACQTEDATFNLCTKTQLYTVVYDGVDGFSVPELCYSGWLQGGEVGYYHNQAGTSDSTCGGADGWQSWSPTLPGAHCCTSFEAGSLVKPAYVKHPSLYAFSSKSDASVACQAYDSDYYLCSKYQLEGISESSDYSYDMCMGGYYDDGSGDETNGFYVALATDSCQSGEVGWHQWCPSDTGLCGAHCCLPSYLDSRTQDMYYGTANGADGTSTLESSRDYCAAQESFPHVCTASQLQAIATAENTNICLAGWAESNDDSNVGELGWYQGEVIESWCGVEGWNDGSFTTIGVAHCCTSYVKEYVEVSVDYEIYPAYYEAGYSSGGDAAAGCVTAGYAGLCTKEQVVWWATNEDPLLCRSGWATQDGAYVTGYYGHGTCGTVGTWHTWAPATPVAHCCNDAVQGASITDPAYVKTGSYEWTTMIDAAAACDTDAGYSLCSGSQLYRVAYGEVDGYSDDNICFTGWVTDGVAGWFQATDASCGGATGWRTWMLDGNKAGAHCCLNDFDGWVIPDGSGFEGVTTTTTTEAPEECQWISVSGLDDLFNGFYTKSGEQFGKYTFTGEDGRLLAYDNEVWSIMQGPQNIVAREVDAGEYPPATSVWDLAELGTNVAYNGNVLCIDSVHYVIPTVNGLVTGQSLTLRLNGESAYDILVENPSTSGTFSLSLPEGYGYEVTIEDPSSDSTTCACSGCTGNVPAFVSITCTPSAVTLGGALNDLADGQSITLQSTIDNTQLLTLTGVDSWTFNNEFTVGQVYGVVIAVQPSGQFCTLSNAQGVVTGIIGNVDVQCVDNMYSVSATVYGLNSDGSGSASLNMANDVITTNQNGVFTFETLLGYGRQYIISSDNPVGYSCTLTGNFGIVSGDVTDVILNCIELIGTSYTVEINFLATRNCLYGNSIQLSEWSFYNYEKQPVLYDYATSTPMANPDGGNEGIDHLYDGNVMTKWLDYTMNPCDASILVHGITLDEEPVYFNFATGNDEPNRDPTEFEVTVCTLVDTVPVTCKTLHYLLEDLSELRSTFQETDFGTTAYSIEIEVLNNNATVVVQNLGNVFGDELTFYVSGTKTFLWQIPQGSSFDVSVSQNPPGQQCTINGVYEGKMTDDVSLSVYCIEGCDNPAFIDDLVVAGYPESMIGDLCVIEDQYYWGGQPLCIAAAEKSLENDTCPYGDKVCGGPLGKTYGAYDMQVELLLEAFGADGTCKADGVRCYNGAYTCCDPNSACLWYFDATQATGDRNGFFDVCMPCGNCDPVLNNCDEECTRDSSDPIFHPRCPPSTCESAPDAALPTYFEDDIEYCINGVDYYYNGAPTCVDTTTYATQQDQDVALENAFSNDYEFGTDECSTAKSTPLLMQDHLYIAGIRIHEYGEIVTYALDNCCLTDDDVSPLTDDWQEQITYFETQTVSDAYDAGVKADLRNIISQLESLLTTLDQL